MNVPANRTASTAIAALGNLKKNLSNVATSIVTPGGDYLLRLVNGAWVYGAENVEVEQGSEWAVNPLSLMHGWVAWTDYKKKKNEIVAEVMVPAGEPLPAYASLREVTDEQGNVLEYSQQISFQLQCLTGEDKGEQVRYKATSIGGMNASKELLNEIIKQLDADIDNPVAVLNLTTDSYIHKVWGKTITPVFEIVDWVPLDDAINAPLPDEPADPNADVKAEAEQPAAEQQRTRRSAPAEQTRAASTEEITNADRQAAIDASLRDLAEERAAARQAAPADAAEPRVRRRR